VKEFEDLKYREHNDALKAGNNGTNSMLHEYNYGVMNPYYSGNVISKWLEEQLRQGDLISDDRVGDLVMREIDKKCQEYNGVSGEQFEKVKGALRMKVHGSLIGGQEEEQ
jgi:hypothetical protein